MRFSEEDLRKDDSTSQPDSATMGLIVPLKRHLGLWKFAEFFSSDERQRSVDYILAKTQDMIFKDPANVRYCHDYDSFMFMFLEQIECCLKMELNKLIAEYNALDEKGRANFDTRRAWDYKTTILTLRNFRKYTPHTMPKVED